MWEAEEHLLSRALDVALNHGTHQIQNLLLGSLEGPRDCKTQSKNKMILSLPVVPRQTTAVSLARPILFPSHISGFHVKHLPIRCASLHLHVQNPVVFSCSHGFGLATH